MHGFQFLKKKQIEEPIVLMYMQVLLLVAMTVVALDLKEKPHRECRKVIKERAPRLATRFRKDKLLDALAKKEKLGTPKRNRLRIVEGEG